MGLEMAPTVGEEFLNPWPFLNPSLRRTPQSEIGLRGILFVCISPKNRRWKKILHWKLLEYICVQDWKHFVERNFMHVIFKIFQSDFSPFLTVFHISERRLRHLTKTSDQTNQTNYVQNPYQKNVWDIPDKKSVWSLTCLSIKNWNNYLGN